MKRYLLTIWQPDGPPPDDLDLDAVMADVDALVEEAKAAGAWVFNGGLHPADTATVLRADGDEMLVTDGPYVEGKEHVGGFLVDRRAGPRRRARVGPQDGAGDRRCRSRSARSCTGLRTVTDRDIERVFREEYGRAVAVLVRVFGDIDVAEEAVQDAFAVAVQRWPATGLPPSPQGWIITTARNRAIDRLRREATRDDRHAQAALLHARRRTGSRRAPCRTTGSG